MYGKMQESGLTKLIPFICISAILGTIYFFTSCDVLGSLQDAGNNAAKRTETILAHKVPALSPAEGIGGLAVGWQ